MKKSMVMLISTVAAALLTSTATCASDEGSLRLHARVKGLGMCLKQVIGPGPEPGSERLYASHINLGGTLDIVAVDPLTGKTESFSSPLASESGAWAMALGRDGLLYVGTLPNAHILRLNWRERRLDDLGRALEKEQYIWELGLVQIRVTV
jgi:hypothetical protein